MLKAWKRLVAAYVLSFMASFAVGVVLTHFFKIEPKAVFELSTKRLSYALPVFQVGADLNIDITVLIFFWNSVGALATMTFIYTAGLFNPQDAALPPQRVRKIFCSKTPMKMLCFLPGCRKIKEEPIRRVYVWLMVPLLGLILLGIESGLSVSAAKYVFGSYLTGIMTLLPHGIIEIPAFALAGATVFSGHLYIKKIQPESSASDIFQKLAAFRAGLPMKKTGAVVMAALLLSGLIEGHVTSKIIAYLAN